MTPGRTSVSGFHYSDPHRENDDSRTGDSDPFWGYGAEGENASVSTCRWGGVAVVRPGALESPLSLSSPGHDSTPLSPVPLFSELPNSGAWAAVPSADIGQLPGSEIGAASPPGDTHQLSVNKSAPPPEPPQRLTRKRVAEAEQAEATPSAKKSADRKVQIAGFTWTLPPDPGKRGAYPRLVFLIGAAISSSASGMMTLAEIRQWIRALYPSMPRSTDVKIKTTLVRESDFINAGEGKARGWKLSDPLEFRSFYEKGIFLTYRFGAKLRDRVLRSSLPVLGQESLMGGSPAPESSLSGPPTTPGTDGDTRLAPELSVKIGGHVLTLPPYSPGQIMPPLMLLCGSAIAQGPEQGSGVSEIAAWIADRYFVRDQNAKRELNYDISRTLSTFHRDFRCTDIRAPCRDEERGGMRWVLENPAGFAASYGTVFRTASNTVGFFLHTPGYNPDPFPPT